MNAPIKLTDRQEQFCQRVVAGSNPTAAYREVYGASQQAAEAHGSRLVGKGRVSARIAELRADQAAAQRITVPFLTRNLLRIAGLAEGSGQHSAAVQAQMGVAKLHGFLIEKHQVDAVIRKPSSSPESPDDMTEAQWVELHGITYDYLDNTTPATTEGERILASNEEAEPSDGK